MAKTYALVGTGGRARMFYEAILGPHREQSRLVALCDTNQLRMDFTNKVIAEELSGAAVPTYKAADFARMIAETRPDTIIRSACRGDAGSESLHIQSEAQWRATERSGSVLRN